MILEVQFHDNDYYNAFTMALGFFAEQLALHNGWEVHDGYRMQGEHGKNLGEIVKAGLEDGTVKAILDRLVDGFYQVQTTLNSFRAIGDDPEWVAKMLERRGMQDGYLQNYKLALHSPMEWNELREEWQNSEYFYVDLDNGTIGSR